MIMHATARIKARRRTCRQSVEGCDVIAAAPDVGPVPASRQSASRSVNQPPHCWRPSQPILRSIRCCHSLGQCAEHQECPAPLPFAHEEVVDGLDDRQAAQLPPGLLPALEQGGKTLHQRLVLL